MDDPYTSLAKSVRQACVEAVIEGFTVAAMRGLCHEGAVEAAVSAVKQVPLEELVADVATADAGRVSEAASSAA